MCVHFGIATGDKQRRECCTMVSTPTQLEHGCGITQTYAQQTHTDKLYSHDVVKSCQCFPGDALLALVGGYVRTRPYKDHMRARIELQCTHTTHAQEVYCGQPGGTDTALALVRSHVCALGL